MPRIDLRDNDQLRPVKITRGYLTHNPHSVLIESGDTRVLCSAIVEEGVPGFKKGSGEGWVTAEYGMLPSCSQQRIRRERNKVSGRTQEIQRLIGRSLRSVVDLTKLGERTIMIDADVIQADGGTRTASITGAFIALKSVVKELLAAGIITKDPISDFLAAISVGIKDGETLLDLPYIEDSTAEVDMNVVMTESGKFIEVQGTAEAEPFSKTQLDEMLELAQKGILELIQLQKEALNK
ncbi:MAG: ribonuclease PH [Candidatus Margulisiibacteriota bacterium]